MKKFLLAVLLTALSISLFAADNETVCKFLSNQICDRCNCYVTKQTHSGKYYLVSLNCPSLWEGDPGFAIVEINQVLNKYSDLVTEQAFTANSGGDLEKIMIYDDLKISLEYFVETNRIIIVAYNIE